MWQIPVTSIYASFSSRSGVGISRGPEALDTPSHAFPARCCSEVELGDARAGPLIRTLSGHLEKDYKVVFAPAAAVGVRGAWLAIGERPTDPASAGELLHGNPYRLHAHVAFLEEWGPDHRLWLTVESWDGTTHQTAWPLREAIGEPRD